MEAGPAVKGDYLQTGIVGYRTVFGVLGGLVAVLILLAGLWALGGTITRLAGLYGSSFQLGGATGASVLAVLGGGVLAGWGGAWMAVSRHLAAIQPKVD